MTCKLSQWKLLGLVPDLVQHLMLLLIGWLSILCQYVVQITSSNLKIYLKLGREEKDLNSVMTKEGLVQWFPTGGSRPKSGSPDSDWEKKKFRKMTML